MRKNQVVLQYSRFLSTLSLRRATFRPRDRQGLGPDFYPRSPCGERPEVGIPNTNTSKISIHALLAESDRYRDAEQVTFWQFLSTLSLRRATPAPVARGPHADISIHALLAESDPEGPAKLPKQIGISIHALLAESDSTVDCNLSRRLNFYPRSPCGERQWRGQKGSSLLYISIHALLAESDHWINWTKAWICEISIHALLAESDHRSYNLCRNDARFLSTLSLRRATSRHTSSSHSGTNFYPRSPCGERHSTMTCSGTATRFLSTLSLRRATSTVNCNLSSRSNFYPRSPCGERLRREMSLIRPYAFLSTLSLRRATYWPASSR